MKKIKIIRIQSRIVVGGPAIHTRLLSEKLNPEKYETILIGGASSNNEKSLVNDLLERGIDCRVIPEMGRDIHFFEDIISFFKLLKVIKKEKPDIVHTHTAKAGALGRLAAFFARVPIVFHTFHGHVFHSYFSKFRTKVYLLIEKLLAKISTVIIVISQSQYDDIVSTYHITKPEKVKIISLGFDWETFSTNNNQSLRLKFNIEPDKYLVGIIGRLVPIKGWDLFIEIVDRLIKDSSGEFRFIIIGDGFLNEYIHEKIKKLNLRNFITMSGWLELKSSVYKELDLVLSTSLNEGTPVSLIEALVSGIPVVASNVGGVKDVLDSYENTWLVNSRNPSDYVSLIKNLAKIKVRLDARVSNEVKFRYSNERLLEDIEKLYTNIFTTQLIR